MTDGNLTVFKRVVQVLYEWKSSKQSLVCLEFYAISASMKQWTVEHLHDCAQFMYVPGKGNFTL